MRIILPQRVYSLPTFQTFDISDEEKHKLLEL